MELAASLARRRMVRAFTAQPVDQPRLERVLATAARAPSAGNSQGVDLVVLCGAAETAQYWDVTLAPERRATFAWPSMLDAPVLVVVCADPRAYVARYGEPDKAYTGLSGGADAWAVPYWFVDAGMAIENLLLAVVAEGLGACFFGIFGHEPAVKAAFGIPEPVRLVGTIALGWADPDAERPGRSAGRARRRANTLTHRGRW